MKNTILLLISLVICNCLNAQYKVRIVLEEKSFQTHDSIFITGAFNNWNPGDKNFMLKFVDSNHKSIVINVPQGNFEYKFSRGDWQKVEKGYSCEEVENRSTPIRRDTTINIVVFNWMDECTSVNLRQSLQYQPDDTNKVNTLLMLADIEISNIDSAKILVDRALKLSKKLTFLNGEASAYSLFGIIEVTQGQFSTARISYSKALKIREQMRDEAGVAYTYLDIANTFKAEENLPDWLNTTLSAARIFEISGDQFGLGQTYQSIGDYYLTNGIKTEALKYHQLALRSFENITAGNGTWGIAMSNRKLAATYLQMDNYTEALQKGAIALKMFQELSLPGDITSTHIIIGNIHEKQGQYFFAQGNRLGSDQKYAEALGAYNNAFKSSKSSGSTYNIALLDVSMGRVHMKLGRIREGRIFMEEGLRLYTESNSRSGLLTTYYSLSQLDSIEGNYKMAYDHYKKYIFYRDLLFNEENSRKAVQSKMQYDFDKKDAIAKAEQEKKDAQAQRTRAMQYFAIAVLGIAILAILAIVFIQWRNNRNKQKTNAQLIQQKEKVETTLTELRSTQSQLIQSEKMASLGELTAGIAHEIQNPLNFVNNFSEVSHELVDEMKLEIDSGNYEEAKIISRDVQQNLAKIMDHGKRAGAIVKSMLQHSRLSNGQKEPTDINVLTEEYIRLAYHGFKARDKEFNAEIRTDFDKSVPSIDIITQDIGRVLLNVVNNAFYAVSEKQKMNSSDYEPSISVVTKSTNNSVVITVRDNGNGIPELLKDKIFQPFFTTKPTGQGTGLGLSLSYDIVRAHGGDLMVQPKNGEGAEFVISLPLVYG